MPYLELGGEIFAFQANIDFDIIANAESLGTVLTQEDSPELILKYGATVSVTPELSLPFSTSFWWKYWLLLLQHLKITSLAHT
jgi:hypothetical protein